MTKATSCGGVVIFRGKILLLYKSYKNRYDGWVLPKGTVEQGETHEQTALREVKEETGLTLLSWRFRGIVTFSQEGFGTEYMCLYTADEFEGEFHDCEEGIMEWVPKSHLMDLSLWEGDKIFLKLLKDEEPFFSLKLSYKGEKLVEVRLNGKELKKN